jgi:hypothetical protein
VSLTDDIVEIMMLKGAYVHACDDRRLEDMLDLFTEDAVLDCSAATNEVWRTKEGIREGLLRWAFALPPGELHTTTNPLITVDGDSATGRWYTLFTAHHDRAPLAKVGTVWGAALYTEKYERLDGRWLIKDIKIDYAYDGLNPGFKQRAK